MNEGRPGGRSKVPFDLNTFKYVQIGQAAEILNRVGSAIRAILRASGAVLVGDPNWPPIKLIVGIPDTPDPG